MKKKITKTQLKDIVKKGVLKFIKEEKVKLKLKNLKERFDNLDESEILSEIDKQNSKKRLSSNNEKTSSFVLKVLEGYLEAMLWTEEDELGPSDIDEISNDTKIESYKDIMSFLQKAKDLINGMEPSQVGHDLWLTRNGHGAGFWDRGLGEVGDKLSNLASEMGTKHAYVGDDKKIHIE